MQSHPLIPSRRATILFFSAYCGSALVWAAMGPPAGPSFTVLGFWLFMACFVLVVSIYYIYRSQSRTKQSAVNETLVYTRPEKDSFCIYLRPFRERGARVKIAGQGWTIRAIVGRFWDIEHALSVAMAPDLLLVAIGDPGKTVGAGKIITTDEDWKDRFFQLCRDARAVFMVPSTSASVLWEIEQIAADTDLLGKTFFIMPPEQTWLPLRLFGLAAGRTERAWRHAQALAWTRGIELPAYDQSGALLLARKDRQGLAALLLNDLHPEAVKAAMERREDAKVRPAWFDHLLLRFTFLYPGAIRGIYVAIVFALLFRSFVFHPFQMPSSAMEPALQSGDLVFVSKFAYGYSKFSLPYAPHSLVGTFFESQPRHGDTIVFKHPEMDACRGAPGDCIDFISRVVGLPGDTVEMIGGVLHLNGEAATLTPTAPLIQEGDVRRLIECRTHTDPATGICQVPQFIEALPGSGGYAILDFAATPSDDMAPVVVKAGHLFVLGNNRDNSVDSRSRSMGQVPMGNVIGRAETVIWSSRGPILAFWRWRADRFFAAIR